MILASWPNFLETRNKHTRRCDRGLRKRQSRALFRGLPSLSVLEDSVACAAFWQMSAKSVIDIPGPAGRRDRERDKMRSLQKFVLESSRSIS